MWQLVYCPRRSRRGRYPWHPAEGDPQSSVQRPRKRTLLPQCLRERVMEPATISLHRQERIQPAVAPGAVSPPANILGPHAGPRPLSPVLQEIFAERPAARPCHFDSARCRCVAAPSEVSKPVPARTPGPVPYPALRPGGLRVLQMRHMARPWGAPCWQWSARSSSRPMGQDLRFHEAVPCLFGNVGS